MIDTVHYFGYYVADAQRERLKLFPSCFSKIEYIADKLESLGADVRLVSAASAQDGTVFRGEKLCLSSKRSLRYFSSLGSKKAIFRKINVVWLRFQMLMYILFCVKKQDMLLVYHSLFYAPVLKFAAKYLRKKFVLEIEDVYSAVTEEAKKFKAYEWDFFKYADSYLCVNDMLAKKLPPEKKKIISYGNYSTYPQYAMPDSEKIRLIYAGVIEQKREAAFLAIESMYYLDEHYQLDIMGFGADADIESMQQRICELNEKKGYECVRYLGMLKGRTYYEALQRGNIALSTHKYTIQNMESADCTFPSKMLVYLANNLRIVAQQLDCLEQSALNPYLNFYAKPEPEAIAHAVEKVNVRLAFNGKEFIQEMDTVFLKKLKNLLEGNSEG